MSILQFTKKEMCAAAALFRTGCNSIFIKNDQFILLSFIDASSESVEKNIFWARARTFEKKTQKTKTYYS